MLKSIDKIFSMLPAVIISYHAFAAIYGTEHISCLANIIFTYIQGVILKLLFRRERKRKSYEYKPIIFTERFHRLKTHYGFPSSHSMFYFQYALDRPSILSLVLFICGASLRIFCEHHRRSEVFFGCLIVLITKIAYKITKEMYYNCFS